MVIATALVVVCGGTGAVARFVVDGLVQSRRLGDWPLGTLVVNLSGSFVLGLLAGLHLAHDTMLVLGTATVGSYTTFSTWMLETHRPAEDGERRLASQNVIVSLAFGLAAVAVGKVIGGLL
jgi:fluoride exporter